MSGVGNQFSFRSCCWSDTGGYRVNPVNSLLQPRYVIDHADARVVFVASERLESGVRDLVASINGPIDLIAIDAYGSLLPAKARRCECLRAAGRETDAAGIADVHVGHHRQAEGRDVDAGESCGKCACNQRRASVEQTDRVAAVLPLYHINAFAVTMLAPLAHGGSLVMPPKFSAAGFWEMAIDHGARGSTSCRRSFRICSKARRPR